MPDARVLDLTVQSYSANQLAIKVKNISGVSLDKPLTMEIACPKYLMDQRIRDAADAAAGKPRGVMTLDAVVTGVEGKFSVWAQPETSDHFVDVMFINDMDKSGAEIPPMMLPAGVEFTILIPLDREALHISLNLPYSYEYDVNPRVDGELELKGEEIQWEPEVTLRTDHQSPTMIIPMTDVKVFWHIKDGVSAVLRGPLPGGNSEWSLSNSTTSDYKMSDGSFQIKAVGPVTYMLLAEVKGPAGKPNVQVARMLSLDVYTTGKYGYVAARPHRVLPLGLVEIDWAAWGFNAVTLFAGDGSRRIPLTDMTLSGSLQGMGVMRVTAGKPEKVTETKVKLVIEVDQKQKTEATASFDVVPWRTMLKSDFTGQPVGLAVAGPNIALLTTDGLWIAKVGEHDFDGADYESVTKVTFTRKTTDTPRAWLAIAAFGKRFVVLKHTNDLDVQVAFFNSEGGPDEVLPIDLPADLRRIVGSGSPIDLAVAGNRAYFVVQSLFQAGPVRRAFSIGISNQKKAEYRDEPLLETMPGYRLLAFDNVLYALNRASGEMFRFVLTAAGKLEAYKAASGVDQSASSMVKQGLLVPVGRVLAVFGPNSVPSLASLAGFGLQNVLRYENVGPLKSAGSIPQDVVYSPQNDRWVRCGRGLDVTAGVVAFRDGDSPRLWLIEPNGNTYTLTVGSEHLFLHDYVTDLPSKPLAPFLNKKRQITIINNTGMQFVPMTGNEACLKGGLTPLSATGPVELISPPLATLRPGITETIELRYNEAQSPATTLRFLMQRPSGVKNEYVLELAISGADLSTATTVFKRIAVEKYGGVSITEVPGTRQQHSTSSRIEFFPKPLIEGIKLTLRNITPYQLWLRSPDAQDEAAREKPYNGEEITIKYNTPAFSIYAHGADELFFDVDFALPNGIEQTWYGDGHTKRIRANTEHPLGLRIESSSVKETSTADIYECTLRYKVERALSGVYIGDGVPSKDGASVYLPVAMPSMVNRSQVLKLRANDLLIEGQMSLDSGGIFSAPNSLIVLADRVLAMVKNNILSQLSPDLKFQGGMPLFWHDVITNLKGFANANKFFTLGMKQESSNPPRYSYSYAARSYSQQGDEENMALDVQKGFRPARVPGAPAWVSPGTISPMDVSAGVAVAICVEGGLILIDLKSKRVMEVAIDGTGREEAVLLDPAEPLIFSAHAQPDTHGLMISRISSSNVSQKQTITLPSTVTHMLTDTRPFVGPNLQYNRPRAVSLAVTPDALFVSHARNIFVLDKQRLTVRQTIPVDLPCRLMHVRRGKPPGEATAKYPAPKECYMVWAVGSMYIGDGSKLDNAKLSVYKIGVML
ncbi:MAG TPA: hypothetical protein VKB02_10795 [Pyrinomonadaceae bacterium]|nr:hypothetical protein [Pyrinomonadaceae bacterium]